MELVWYVAKALFRNKGFLVNLKTERNVSKFAMFMEKEKSSTYVVFWLINLGYVR